MHNRTSEILFLVCILIGAIVVWQSADQIMPTRRFSQVDADLWPRMIIIALGLATGLLLIQKLAALRNAPARPRTGSRESAGYYFRLGLIASLILLYYVGLQQLGFFLATLAFVWAASCILPLKSLLTRVLFAPIFTLALGFFFSRALSLPLPRGQGVFYTFSTALF